ncbi:ATP-binding protein [Streptomyces rishiriensis]|uniref:ATP-binding protein n=1 Tax=Streptomyces rishiriensis TaxID=68264 RepID=UPI0037AE20AE
MSFRTPIQHLHSNLIWTRQGTVWAMWRLHPIPYGFGNMEEKQRVLLAHQHLFQALHGESMLMGFCADMDPAAVVERMLEGLDLRSCRTYLEEIELTLAELEEMPVGERAFWLAMPLRNATASDRAKTRLSSMDAILRERLALPTRYPGAEEISAWQQSADAIQEMIPAAFTPRRATAAEVAWVTAHCHTRGLGLDKGVPTQKATEAGVTRTAAYLPTPWLDEGGRSDRDPKDHSAKSNPFQDRYLKVASEATDGAASYQVMMALTGTPVGGFAFPGGEFISYLDRLPVDADWTLRMSISPASKVGRRNRRAETNLQEEFKQQGEGGSITGASTKLDRLAAALGEYHAALNASEREVEVQATIIVAVGADTAEQAQADARYVARHYADREFKLAPPLGHQEDLWGAMLPGAALTREVQRFQQVTTGRFFAMGVPIVSDDLGTESGFQIATNVSSTRRSPVYMDIGSLMEQDGSGSFGVTGENGSGKSTFLKIVAGNVYDRGGQIMAVDRSDNLEWAALGALLTASQGGQPTVVDVSNPSWSLDPMRIFDPREAVRITQSLCAVLLGIRPQEPRGALLGRMLRDDYRQEHTIDSLNALRLHLEAGAAGIPQEHPALCQDIGFLMSNMAATDLGRVMFDETLPPLQIQSRCLVFCTHGVDLPTADELNSASLKAEMPVEKIIGRGLYALIVAICKAVGFADDSQESLFIVDEAHHATGSPETVKEIKDIVRYGRKHKHAVALGSHDASSDFGPQELQALIPIRFVFRARDEGMARRNLAWLGSMDQPEWIEMVMEDMSPMGVDGVPMERRGEALMRDARGRIGKIQARLPRSEIRRKAVLTTPPKRKNPTETPAALETLAGAH